MEIIKSIPANTMQTRNQRKRKERENECLQHCPEVLRLVSRSGFLKVKELGRFLFFISPSFIANLFTENEIWIVLLQSRFAFDNDTLNSLSMNAKHTFLAYSKQVKRRPIVKLKDLCYAPEDYEIIVNMFEMREGTAAADDAFDNAFFTTIIRGHDCPEFFKNGQIELNDEGNLGCHPDSAIRTTIHVHRLTDGKTVCIYNADATAFSDGRIDFDFDDEKLEMEDPVYSKYLMDTFEIKFGQGVGIDFRLVIDSEEFHVPVPDETASGFIICAVEKFTIASLNISAEIELIDEPNAEAFPKEPTNATFAHFLEGMHGWNN
eukprot:scaffold10177_cov250-Chaetoceros_neogracile.AAC.6